MNRYFKIIVLSFIIIFVVSEKAISQNDSYWQQRVKYTMQVEMDVEKHSYDGYQHLIYYNNSPDTIRKVYYHLFYNAFQPGSIMAKRAESILDPDKNMDTTIQILNKSEIGFEKVLFLKQNGRTIDFEILGTILKGRLNIPLLPGDSTVLDMVYQVQIPKMVRRAGWKNKQGVDYSMAQWYPKLAEYDHMGWHPDPYISREFYGVWGDFDVTVTIDKDYKLAAGSESVEVVDLNGDKKKWHFKANNIHDFVWAADRDFKHFSLKANDQTVFNYYYQDIGKRDSLWHIYAPIMVEAFKFMNKRYGKYQYGVYNFIEGGDGGMEYPLATLITGKRSVNSLVGISTHEFMHSWYQMQLATNESLYAWMDEGFTSFATVEVLKYLTDKGLINRKFKDFPYMREYKRYVQYMKNYHYEPMNIHADHYETNYAYYSTAYTGGLIFLKQMEYIVGKKSFDRGLLEYFNKWKFKHPKPNDFIRVMEKESDIELDWYLDDFVNSNKYINYAIDTVYSDKANTIIIIDKIGNLHMPVDIEILYTNGVKEIYNIPRQLMYGSKKEDLNDNIKVISPWSWVDSSYLFTINKKLKKIQAIMIDSSKRLLDVDRKNNVWVRK